MEYLAPFQNRTKMTFSPIPWGGKEYLQASFNITDHLHVKLLSIHSAALGRRVCPGWAPAETLQGQASAGSDAARPDLELSHADLIPSSQRKIAATNMPLKPLPLQRGQNYSSPAFPSLLNSPLGAVLLMKIISSVLLPKWMQPLCQHPTALPVSNSFLTWVYFDGVLFTTDSTKTCTSITNILTNIGITDIDPCIQYWYCWYYSQYWYF